MLNKRFLSLPLALSCLLLQILYVPPATAARHSASECASLYQNCKQNALSRGENPRMCLSRAKLCFTGVSPIEGEVLQCVESGQDEASCRAGLSEREQMLHTGHR